MVDEVVLGSVGFFAGSVGLDVSTVGSVVGLGSSSTSSMTFWIQEGLSKPGISSSPWKYLRNYTIISNEKGHNLPSK